MPFIITGRIRELESGIGVPNLRIEGWDRDLFFDDKLGEGLTDAEGRFRIIYTEEDFRDLFERRPDMYDTVAQCADSLWKPPPPSAEAPGSANKGS